MRRMLRVRRVLRDQSHHEIEQQWIVAATGLVRLAEIHRRHVEHQRTARPNAIRDLAGSVARAPLLPGEPVTAQKIVKPGEGSVFYALLPRGSP